VTAASRDDAIRMANAASAAPVGRHAAITAEPAAPASLSSPADPEKLPKEPSQ
jgi:hypothetical protein